MSKKNISFLSVISLCIIFSLPFYSQNISEKLIATIDFSSMIKGTIIESPNCKHVAYVAQSGNKQCVVVDGKEENQYNAIGGLTFSPDGKRIAYAALLGNKQCVVVDGKEENQYDGIGGLTFSPDGKRIAYAVVLGNKWFEVINGKEGQHYDAIGNDLIFSSDGMRVAYIGNLGKKWFVVVDGKEENHYDGIGGLTFSPDGKRIAYAAQLENKMFVVIDGKEDKKFDGIGASGLIFSPDGTRTAYAARLEKKWFVVLDGKEKNQCDGIECLIFSPDGKRIAYATRLGKKWFVVVDGKEGNQYEAIRELTFSPNGKRIAYAAQFGYKQCVVVDGKEGQKYDDVYSLIFNPDGTRVAYEAKLGSQKYLLINGNEVNTYYNIISDIKFDTPNSIHYLAQNGNNIHLMEEVIDDKSIRLSEKKLTQKLESSYKTIKIGEQIWMAENLNVDHYRNGDPIPEVKDPEQWKNLTSGAWCYYDNDPENGKKYCKLYNWYAVNDPRGLAPKGWHIPTRAEFKTLVATVNQDGNALKAIVQGRGDGAGINTSGFSILMAGRRDRKSNFSDLGEVACFWGSTENQNSTDYANYLHLTSDYVNYDYDQKDYGFSVRCMKNTNISPETVKIGDQEWMTENLNVDHYRNGDPIPEIQDSVLWKNLKMGAWCYYNNDPENSDKYGKLYNWYAVDDSRGLAPEGWHIPTQAELQTLVKNVNNNATELLAIGQGFGSNTVGFSALLAGYRYLTGDFNQPRENASFWSSSAVDHKQTVRIAVSPNQYKNFTNTLTIITYMRLIGNKINILSAEAGENFGFSIRCVKN